MVIDVSYDYNNPNFGVVGYNFVIESKDILRFKKLAKKCLSITKPKWFDISFNKISKCDCKKFKDEPKDAYGLCSDMLSKTLISSTELENLAEKLIMPKFKQPKQSISKWRSRRNKIWAENLRKSNNIKFLHLLSYS